MLKKICRLFLGLMVCTGSVCVTPTHASSALPLDESSTENFSIVIAEIQVGGSAGAKDEMIAVYNNSSVAVDITDWCLINKSTVAFACFTEDLYEDFEGKTIETHFILPAYSMATIASHEYLTARNLVDDSVTITFAVTNQSSGSLVGSSDSLSLVTADGDVVDAHTWTSAPANGKVMQRIMLFTMPTIYSATNTAADWLLVTWNGTPKNEVELQNLVVINDNSNDDSAENEGGVGADGTGEGDSESDPILNSQLSPIVITELLPNPAGSDVGKEFIELYNPSETEQSLGGLKLRIGMSNFKWYVLPTGMVLAPHAYTVFSNSALGFSLVNTNSGVQLYQTIYEQDVAIGEVVEYTSPKDDQAWALVDGVWQYTTLPTPGADNLSTPMKSPANVTTSAQKPCAANQFRNPETGRCKLLSAVLTTAAACKPGQVRNLQTNRCRNSTNTTKTQTPCKEGQERNPETNRCRNVKVISNAEYGVKGVQTKAGESIQWYYWVAIIGIVLVGVCYGVWEWRDELRRAGRWVWGRMMAIK